MTDELELNRELNREPNVTNFWQFAYQYSSKHGTLVFGVLTVLLIWQIMVVPELERATIQREIMQEALQNLKTHTETQRDTADHMRKSALLLDNTAKTLEGTTRLLNELSDKLDAK